MQFRTVYSRVSILMQEISYKGSIAAKTIVQWITAAHCNVSTQADNDVVIVRLY